MAVTTETKVFLGIILATLAIIVGAVVFTSRPAAPTTVSADVLAPATAWATGSATPKATLVEFSDFQCPACKAAGPEIKSLLAKYPQDLRVVYRYFPLSQHPYGEKSAIAAEAAGRQGKFWQMHDLLFANQDILSDATVLSFAQNIGLNIDQFKKDIADPTVKDKVDHDAALGNQLGVDATPTFYLNGQQLSLQNFTDLDTAIANLAKS